MGPKYVRVKTYLCLAPKKRTPDHLNTRCSLVHRHPNRRPPRPCPHCFLLASVERGLALNTAESRLSPARARTFGPGGIVLARILAHHGFVRLVFVLRVVPSVRLIDGSLCIHGLTPADLHYFFADLREVAVCCGCDSKNQMPPRSLRKVTRRSVWERYLYQKPVVSETPVDGCKAKTTRIKLGLNVLSPKIRNML
jgi:hypothetical protein